MPPLPPIWDPCGAQDKLPQPYRMIDKVLAEILEKVLDVVGEKVRIKKAEEASRVDLTFAPHAVVQAAPDTTNFVPLGIAGVAICAAPGGQLVIHSARDAEIKVVDNTHTSTVTALEASYCLSTNGRIVACASRELVTLHEVDPKTCEVRLLAKSELPQEVGSSGVRSAPWNIKLSPNLGHLAINYKGGAVIVYRIRLPPPPAHLAATADLFAAMSLTSWGETKLQMLVHLSMKHVEGLLAGSLHHAGSQVVWQLQQRPDKNPNSDRYHKAARGAYIWWHGANRLLLINFESIESASAASTAAAAPPAAGKPSTPPPGTPPPPAGATSASASSGAGGLGTVKSWVLPHGITACAATYDAKTLAFGLANGSVFIWDDAFGGHTKVLPRLGGAATALAFVHGLPHKLLCAASDGSLFLHDLVKPEDSSQKPFSLPLPVSALHFLPNEPYCLCVCLGDDKRKARLIWFNIGEEKLVAELTGPDLKGFGTAACQSPIDTPRPGTDITPPPDAAAAAAASQPAVAAAPDASTAAAAGDGRMPPAAHGPIFQWPAWRIVDSYMIVGGDVVAKERFKSNFATEEELNAPPEEVAQLYMWKIDALVRFMLPPDEVSAVMARGMDSVLADLQAPAKGKKKGRRVKMDIEDPDAPKIASSLRKPDPLSDEVPLTARSTANKNRHIAFDEDDLFNDEATGGKKVFPKETKVFPKELRRGGETGGTLFMDKQAKGASGKHKLAPLDLEKAKMPDATPFAERSQSPPWHHTNPLARIHPDWEEAPVLARVMDKLGTKGGGRKKRDKHIDSVLKEMSAKFAKEAGAKPNLLVS